MVKDQVTTCTLKMAPIMCPETSARKDHSLLRKNPDERRSDLHCGGSFKSHVNILP